MLKNDTQQGPPDVCGMVRSPVIPKREIPFSGGIFMASGVQYQEAEFQVLPDFGEIAGN